MPTTPSWNWCPNWPQARPTNSLSPNARSGINTRPGVFMSADRKRSHQRPRWCCGRPTCLASPEPDPSRHRSAAAPDYDFTIRGPIAARTPIVVTNGLAGVDPDQRVSHHRNPIHRATGAGRSGLRFDARLQTELVRRANAKRSHQRPRWCCARPTSPASLQPDPSGQPERGRSGLRFHASHRFMPSGGQSPRERQT